MSSGTNITAVPKDLTLDASWTGPGLPQRIWSEVQNTGDEKVYFCELAAAPTDLTDVRWRYIDPGKAVDLMAGGIPIWARCADGETSKLAATIAGRPTRYR